MPAWIMEIDGVVIVSDQFGSNRREHRLEQEREPRKQFPLDDNCSDSRCRSDPMEPPEYRRCGDRKRRLTVAASSIDALNMWGRKQRRHDRPIPCVSKRRFELIGPISAACTNPVVAWQQQDCGSQLASEPCE